MNSITPTDKPKHKPRVPLTKNAIRLICCNNMTLEKFNNNIRDNHRYTFSNIESIVDKISETEIGMKSQFVQLIEDSRMDNYIFDGSMIRMILGFPDTRPNNKNAEQQILYGTISNFAFYTMENIEKLHESKNGTHINIELNDTILEKVKSYGTLIYTDFYIVKHDQFEPEYLINVKHKIILSCVNENLYGDKNTVYKEYLSLNGQVKVYVKYASNGSMFVLRSAYYDNNNTNSYVIFESSTIDEEQDEMKYERRVVKIKQNNYYYIPVLDIVIGSSYMFVVHNYSIIKDNDGKTHMYDVMGVYDIKNKIFYESKSVDETNSIVKLSAQGQNICVNYKKIVNGNELNPIYEYYIMQNCGDMYMTGGRKYGHDYKKKWFIRIY